MSYDFTFDLSKLSQKIFTEIADFSEKGRVPERIGNLARNIVNRFKVNKITGLPVSDSITVVEDIIKIYIQNRLHKERFLKSNKRALFLPHCCRKYMDSRCKAEFDSETSSYICKHCSKDCLVNKATILAKKENYDVYVLPGASCVRKIFQKDSYDGIIGVACTDELKLATNMLDKDKFGLSIQCIPLIKNGCSDTSFNFESLKEILKRNQN